MSMRDKQLKRISDIIIKESLESGFFPSTSTYLSRLVEKTNGKLLGMPTMKVREADFRKVTNKEDLNKMFSEAKVDIASLFDEAVDAVNGIVLGYDYIYTWRERIRGRMRDIYEAMDSIKSVPPYRYVKSMGSYRGIETGILDEAYVNLREGVVTLPGLDAKIVKHDISNSSIDISFGGDILEAASLSSENNIKDDNINSTWHYVVLSKTSKRIQVAVDIKLASAKTISKVSLIGHTPGVARADVRLAGSDVGLGARPFEISNVVSWNTAPITTDTIRIVLTKDEPDDTIGDINRYHFGLQNVSLFYVEYKDYAFHQTKSITFNDVGTGNLPIGSFVFNATQDASLNTEINWYYSYDIAENKTWFPINPGDTVAMSVARTSVASTINGAASALPHAIRDRVAYYNIASVPTEATDMVIRRAKNCWKVDSYKYIYDEGDEAQYMNPDPVPTMTDFIELRQNKSGNFTTSAIRTRYMDVGESNDSMLHPFYEKQQIEENASSNYYKERVMHRLTSYIYFKENTPKNAIERLKEIKIPVPSSMFGGGEARRSSIYFNGARALVNIPAINSTLSEAPYIVINMQPGWNKIEIVMNNYSPSGKLDIGHEIFRDLINGTNVTGVFGGATPVAAIEWWGERYPMIEVSSYELFYQTSRNDNTRFTVLDGNVIVNYLPYYRHDMLYKNVSLGSLPKQMYMKAELLGSSGFPTVTPRIYEYGIEMFYE